jgi:mono/diheme cytochrome c family protein
MHHKLTLTKKAVLLVSTLAFFTLLAVASQTDDSKADAELVARGKYLTSSIGCNDCHAPKIFTPAGAQFDSTRLFSGHPADEKLPDNPQEVLGGGRWGAASNANFTAWVGPWGVSFASNLTPDKETGLGNWTEKAFIMAMRTGKHRGVGRPILPPMPWPNYAQMTDEDLRAIFAYLQTVPPIRNKVPDPIAP